MKQKYVTNPSFASYKTKFSWTNISTAQVESSMHRSLVPRPLPDLSHREFSPRLQDKIWEWPGDEAICTACGLIPTTVPKCVSKLYSDWLG